MVHRTNETVCPTVDDDSSSHPAYNYLLYHGLSKSRADCLMNPEGFWKHRYDIDPLGIDVTDMREVETILNQIDSSVEPVYEAAQVSMDSVNTRGFTDHTINHIRWVHDTANRLPFLLGVPIDSNASYRLRLASYFHDLGNIFDRKNHAYISPVVATMIFPAVKNHPHDWQIVTRAINRHESNGYDEVMDRLGIDGMNEYFSHEDYLLMMADKCHVGRERVRPASRQWGVLDAAIHTAVNMHIHYDGVTVDDTSRMVNWRFKFDPTISEGDVWKYRDIAVADNRSPSGLSCYAPESMRAGSDLLPDFDASLAQLHKIYARRVGHVLTYVPLAMRPDLQGVTISFENGYEKEECVTFIFPRDGIKKAYNDFVEYGIEAGVRYII